MNAGRFNLTALALRYRSVTLFFVIAIAIAGAASYFKLGQREDPDFAFRAMIIRTIWPGATTEQVDQQITDRIDKKLQETPYYKWTRAYSKPGESLIILELLDTAPAKEVPQIWYQVRKKIGDIRAFLPPEALGPFFNDEFGDVFGSIYALTGQGYSLSELRDVGESVRQSLLRLPNVSKIELVGIQEDRIFVELSPNKLSQLALDANAIAAQLQAQNALSPTGTIQGSALQLPLRVTGQLQTLDQVRELRLTVGGRIVRLADVAESITRGYVDPPQGAMYFQGKPSIGLAVSMQRDGDVLKLGSDLTSTLAKLKTELPVGVEINQVSNQPKIVEAAVGEFTRSLIEALLIVLAVSFLSLGARTGLVVALTIPFVMAATFLGMRYFDIALHRISTGALIIALGLLVDDAMIAVEMMARKIEEGWDKVKAATFAYTSTAFPMLTGTLITVAGFLPIVTAKSTTGEYTIAIFQVISLALLISWLAAIIVTPLLGVALLRDRADAAKPDGPVRRVLKRVLPKRWMAEAAHGEHEVFDTPFYRALRRTIAWCVKHRWVTLAATLGAFVLGGVGMGLTEKQFFPTSDRAEFIVELWLPEGASYSATEREAKRMEAMLKDNKDITSYVTYVGFGSPRYYLALDQQQQRSNFAQIIGLTADKAGATRAVNFLRERFAKDFPGVRGRAYLVPLGPPVNYPIQFRIIGTDIAAMKPIADQVAAAIRAHPAVENTNVDWGDQAPALRIEVDQDKARALGLTSVAIARTLAGTVSGSTIAQLREGDRLIDVVLRSAPGKFNDPITLGALQMPTATGKPVPLSQVASIKQVFEEPIIWRRSREIALTARADLLPGFQAPDVATQIDPAVDAIRAKLPPGVRIEIGGAFEENVKAQSSIAAGGPLALGLVMALLMLQLRRFSTMAMVLVTAPLGIIGVAAALLIAKRPLGFVAFLGVIALAGMIMRNTVILVDQIQQDIEAGMKPWDAIIDATVRRFRPICLTAAAAVLAMIPLSRSILWGPMGVAIMGGLIVATVLTVLAVPALYAAWYRIKESTPSPSGRGSG